MKNNKTVDRIVTILVIILFVYIWFTNRGFNGLIKEPFANGWNKHFSPSDDLYIK